MKKIFIFTAAIIAIMLLEKFYFLKQKYCDFNMAYIDNGKYSFCIDKYEASFSQKLGQLDLNQDSDYSDFFGIQTGTIYDSGEYSYEKAIETEISKIGKEFMPKNMELILLEKKIPIPSNEANKTPWTKINRYQADVFCKVAGKRLPTNYEWYLAAQGTPDYNKRPQPSQEKCNIFNFYSDELPSSIPEGSIITNDDSVKELIQTGTAHKCNSKYGTYDMVGNAWEWIDEIATQDENGDIKVELSDKNKQKILVIWPQQGYVEKINENTGHPCATSQYNKDRYNLDSTYTFADQNCSNSSANFSDDGYGCNKFTANLRGLMRGGSAINGLPAGINRVDLDDAPSINNFAMVGFRCVKDV